MKKLKKFAVAYLQATALFAWAFGGIAVLAMFFLVPTWLYDKYGLLVVAGFLAVAGPAICAGIMTFLPEPK